MDNIFSLEQQGITLNSLPTFDLCRDADHDVFRRSLIEAFEYDGSFIPLNPCSVSVPPVLRAVHLTHMTLGVVRFGIDIRIVAARTPAYHLILPMRGRRMSRYGSRDVNTAPGLCAVNIPDTPCSVPYVGAEDESICIRIRRKSLERELEAMIGRPVRSAVKLELRLDFATSFGQSLLSILGLLFREFTDPASLAYASRAHLEQLERLVISSLLRTQTHNLSDVLWCETQPARSRTVKRVVDAIEAGPDRLWSLAELAHVAGVSGRRLQQAFQEQFEISPMTYLQNVRLERVRRDLLNDAGSVTYLAMQWGFTHLGRFSGAYRVRYGEAPSETRRRSHTSMFHRLEAIRPQTAPVN